MAEPYCFGRFTLYPDKRQLYSDGVPTTVGSTAVGILLALVEQAGTVVSKDDLMSRVWGRAAVADSRLHVHVHELRKAIGDDFIATKSGRGYRFVAPVRRSEAQSVQEPGRGGFRVSGAQDGPAAHSLIGRGRELEAIAAYLARERLLTLTGPGGVGKTSLAVHIAGAIGEHFPDGVWFVDLAALKDAALVPSTLATVLGLKAGQSSDPRETIARQLARKTLLIVLDNCEHVVCAAALLAEAALRSAPGVKILATSRTPLSCRSEQVFEVRPLALPQEGGGPRDPRETPAVALFFERARAAYSGFHPGEEDTGTVVRICRRLDGLPLAIEMAAGWAGILGIETLDARLDGALRARGAASPRHSTMSAALEWSFDLLAPAERSVLQRLAVFARGFSMADAETVVADKILTRHDVLEQVASLVRKSMIAVVAEPGMPRYRLFETTRAFVLEQLAQSEDAEIVRQRHADYVLYQLERATEEWETTSDPVWLNRHEILLDDLRAALEWATHRNPEQVVALAGASWLLWREMALHAEGRKRLEAAAKHLAPGTPARLEARLRRGLGELWSNTAAVQRARDEFGRAVELYRDLEDWFQLGAALSRLAFTQLILADGEDAKRSIAEALKLLGEFGAPHSLASAYSTEVCVEARVGSYEKACAVGARAIDLCEAIGAERVGFAIAGNLMECALERNDIDAALEQGRALAARLHDGMHPDLQAFVLGLLTSALVEHGEFDKALSVAREAAPLMRDEGILIRLLDHLALRAGLTDRLNDAARVFGYADSIYRASTQPREPILQRAADRLGEILDAAMPEVEIRQLGREGEKLSEDQVVALALKA